MKEVQSRLYCTIIITAVLTTVTKTTITPETNCIFQKHHQLFILVDLHKDEPYKIHVDTGILAFNFCKSFTYANCNQANPSFMFFLKENQTKCNSLTSSSTTNFQAQYQIQKQYSDQNVLTIKYGQQLIQTGNRISQIKIICSQQQFTILSAQLVKQSALIVAKSIHGCPVYQIPALLGLIQEYNILVAVLGFIIGFFFLFFGRVMLKIVSFLSIALTITIGLSFEAFRFMEHDIQSVYLYLCLLAIIILSILISFLATRFCIQISLFFVGVLFAFFIMNTIQPFFLNLFRNYPKPLFIAQTIFSFTTVFCMLMLGLLTLKHRTYFIIVATSTIGGYLIVRAVSLIVGGFPSEYSIGEMIANKQMRNIPASFYIYIGVMLLLNAIGFYYQRLKLLKIEGGQQQLQINEEAGQSSLRQSLSSRMETNLDVIHEQIQNLINRYRPIEELDLTISLPAQQKNNGEMEMGNYIKMKREDE